MQIQNFTQALNYLNDHIPQNPSGVFSGSAGLKRTIYLLNLLKNPQDKIKLIHIAGTSGKSSTSYLLSRLLISSGKTAGLFTSPHIWDIRERILINGRKISKSLFAKNLNTIIPAIGLTAASPHGKPTYFEILTALAYYTFKNANLDYAVIETGLGGLLDATNAARSPNKLSVITRLGLDHTAILGDDIQSITAQKAGIISEKSAVICLDQELTARRELISQAKLKNAFIYFIQQNKNYFSHPTTENKSNFSFKFLHLDLPKIVLGLTGEYQIENAALALSALAFLASRDKFRINSSSIRRSLRSAKLEGRFTLLHHKDRTLVLDGAHNPQKIKAFITSLRKIFPANQFHFLIAFKENKDIASMLDYIIPAASKITISSFSINTQDFLHKSAQTELIADILKQKHFSNFAINPDSNNALKNILESEKNSIIIITGSFYLLNTLKIKTL